MQNGFPKAMLLVVLAAAPLSCRKAKVSHDYLEASGEYSILVARMGDDAYSDPQMDQIVTQLGQVPADSQDGPAAQKLKDTIAAERKRVADAAEAHRKALLAVDPANMAPTETTPSTPEPEPVPDAGPPEAKIQLGMTEAELLKATQACFRRSGPVKLRAADKGDVEGTMYERTDSTVCATRWPKQEGKILVFTDGKLQGEYPKNALKQEVTQVQVPADAGFVEDKGPPGANSPAPANGPPGPPGSPVVPAPAQNEIPAPR